MFVQSKKCTTRADKIKFLKFWCDPIYLVANYIKAYSSEQVVIPSLYDGKFKKNAVLDLDIDKVIRPPVAKKI